MDNFWTTLAAERRRLAEPKTCQATGTTFWGVTTGGISYISGAWPGPGYDNVSTTWPGPGYDNVSAAPTVDTSMWQHVPSVGAAAMIDTTCWSAGQVKSAYTASKDQSIAERIWPHLFGHGGVGGE